MKISNILLTNSLMSRTWKMLCLIVSLVFSVSMANAQVNQGNSDNTFYVDNQTHNLFYSGGTRDFIVPASAVSKTLYLYIDGGDGGTVSYKNNLTSGKGGQGARVSAFLKVGSDANQIPVGSTIRFYIAAKGTPYENHGQTEHHSGGGGGSSAIALKRAGSANWELLMEAGGGGGGFAQWGQKSTNGDPGNNSLSATRSGDIQTDSDENVNSGGYGYHYGGYGNSGRAGGGGGYQNGAHGSTVASDGVYKNAGGGGSYTNLHYCVNPTMTKRGIIENPVNGAAGYVFSNEL